MALELAFVVPEGKVNRSFYEQLLQLDDILPSVHDEYMHILMKFGKQQHFLGCSFQMQANCTDIDYIPREGELLVL